MHFANGITGSTDSDSSFKHFFRASPSGGALYPNEIYLLAFKVRGLSAGIYHYDPIENHLHVLSRKSGAKELSAITYTEEINGAAAVIAITGISLKNRVKYGERGYRFMLMEAGHIAQNILLTANSLRLPCFPIGGFIDDEMNDLLGIDGLDEVSLYLVAVGGRVGTEERSRRDKIRGRSM